MSKFRESTLERACLREAKSRGFALYKIAFRGRVGFPDRMLVSPSGAVTFVEFKRPGKNTADLHQEAVHEELRRYSLQVEIVSSKERFRELLEC